MAKILRTSLAQQDAAYAWCYIAEENYTAADSMLDQIDARIRQVAEFPESGELIAKYSLRRVIVKPFVIYYRLIEGGIEIIRILHAARRHDDVL